MEKEELTISNSPSLTTAANNKVEQPDQETEKDDFKAKLANLPEQYREEILKQYDLPDANATLLAVFKYATWKDNLLMVIGSLMAIASGM